MKSRHRKYKLDANDLAKVYKITKRKTPQIPNFEDQNKILPETDIDNEHSEAIKG